MVSRDRKGLTGEDIDENKAKEIAKQFTGVAEDKIDSKGFSENGDIPVYNFEIKMENDGIKSIAISKKGGHIVYMDYYREVTEEKINPQELIEIGKKFLNEKR